MKPILIFYLIFGLLNISPHEDTPIKLNKDGTLVGLPEKYSPANFNPSTLTLEVAKNKIILPNCVSTYITDIENPTFSFFASWYHFKFDFPEVDPLPDYMYLQVSSATKNQSDVQIMFNLETLEVFEINILEENVVANGTAYSLYYNEQEISNSCKQNIFNSISKK